MKTPNAKKNAVAPYPGPSVHDLQADELLDKPMQAYLAAQGWTCPCCGRPYPLADAVVAIQVKHASEVRAVDAVIARARAMPSGVRAPVMTREGHQMFQGRPWKKLDKP